jgi:S-adenosylmethionine hydrolase
VGPDNGLLWPAIERLGGLVEAADISLSSFRLEPLSATFHGRDVFAPVAATLALGGTLGDVGAPLPPDALTTLESSQARIEDGRTLTHVAYLDHYGNAVLDLGQGRLPETGLRLGHPTAVETRSGRVEGVFARTFADVGEGRLLLYVDSYGSLALAINRGSAAADLRLAPGDEVVLRPV